MTSDHRIRWGVVAGTVGRVMLPIWFIAYDALILSNYSAGDWILRDAAVYREAAVSLLAGADPWAAQVGGLYFAGPPPTLLLYLPTAVVPLPVAVAAVTTVLIVAAIWSVRRLQLPLWWVLFPPIFESVIVGNPDVLVLALLLVRGPLAGLAVVTKVYAIVPLLLQRRWRALILGVAVSVLTLPLWPAFFLSLPSIAATLDIQSRGFSAWGSWFVVPTVIALWVLRRRGADWLVVPALWPNTQVHYAAMSLPVVRSYPIAAVVIGFGSPLAPAVAVIIVAVQSRWRAARGVEAARKEPWS
jgi:hypothetical protein